MSPKKVRIEVVKQVRLAPNQRVALLDAHMHGGKFERTRDYNLRVGLEHLKLIERRRLTPAAKADIDKRVDAKWKELAGSVKARRIQEAEMTVSAIQSLQRSREAVYYHLTKEGLEYVEHGRVTVTV